MGTFIAAPKGSGKSRLMGRGLAWQDFLHDVPLIILDPVGGTIDNFLDKIRRGPSLQKQREYWKRVRYVPMSGYQGYVSSWPIYYEAKTGESFSTRAQRFVDVIARVDPALQTAGVQGFNALSGAAHPGGIVLCALGLGIYHLWDLLRDPTAWEPQLQRLEKEYPETVEAIDDLRMLAVMSDRDRLSQLMSLRNKLRPLRLDPTFKAVFGGTAPSITWDDVVKKKQAVLIDFRGMPDEMKKFALLWVYNSFLTFIKHRGHSKMRDPVSFIIDELTYMVGTAGTNADLLTADINELVNQISRSHGVWVTLATQELFQLPPKMRQTVLSMGTVILGQMSDNQAAEELARRYFTIDPYKEKARRTRFEKVRKGTGRFYEDKLVSAGDQVTWFTRGEQNYENSRVFLNLKKFHFLVGQSEREGELPTELNEVSIEDLDRNQFQDSIVTDPIRAELARRDGIKQSQLLKRIDKRLAQPPPAAEYSEAPTEQPAPPATPHRPDGIPGVRPKHTRKPPRGRHDDPTTQPAPR
ncbi:hypothetical protein [Geodermatophilus sp. URMC 65]